MELTTGADLMLAMVYAQELGDWDYSGMYTAVLKHKVGPCLSLCEYCMPGVRAGAGRLGLLLHVHRCSEIQGGLLSLAMQLHAWHTTPC